MSTSSHIAVFAFPFGTHTAPLLDLVQRLAASAPDVKFSFFSTSESNSLIFSGSKADDLGNIKAYNVSDGIPDGHIFGGNQHLEAVGLFIKATPDNFVKVVKEAEEDAGVKISCLVTDAFLWFACDLAEEIGVPWIPFWTAASSSLSAHLYTDEIRREIATSERSEQTLALIPGLQGLNINDLPNEVLMDSQESPLAHMLYNMALKLPKATAVVLNSFEEIDPAITTDLKSMLKKFLNIGPSPLLAAASKKPPSADKDECLSWLEKQNNASVVYISFGTVISPPPDEIVALANALETCEVPFLWSLKDHAKKHLPEGFIDRARNNNGKFVTWAPQVRVLEHGAVGVFVTHCGWNSILESISFGVPLICRPFFGDQKLNSRMVQDGWKIGLKVDGGVFTKSGTINAIQYILSSDKGKAISENVRVLKEKALDAVKPNGSSTRNFQELIEIVTKSPVQ
ncbi:hypothetical protein ACH5RR_006384 [Cinchona calisaya]|uniref:Glycosyltransferase n=1 Tax=Cinchona calisaya TaxID=153742 RepID=A0ABD3AP66_9GENT